MMQLNKHNRKSRCVFCTG